MFERSFSFALATGTGPAANCASLNLPDKPLDLILEAWISNFGSSNVHILEGKLTVAQCQGQLESGATGVLMTVTGAGPSRIALPDDVRDVTVFFEIQQTSGQFQVATLRVHERGCES